MADGLKAAAAAEDDATAGMGQHGKHFDDTRAPNAGGKVPLSTQEKARELQLKQQKKLLLTGFANENHVRIDTLERVWDKVRQPEERDRSLAAFRRPCLSAALRARACAGARAGAAPPSLLRALLTVALSLSPSLCPFLGHQYHRMNPGGGESNVDFETFCLLMEVEGTGEYRELFHEFDEGSEAKIDLKLFMLGLLNFTHTEREQRINFRFDGACSLACLPPACRRP